MATDRDAKSLPTYIWTFLVVVWVAAIAGGMGTLIKYKATPNRNADAPRTWPSESAIERQPGRATLVMLAHPHCPCTRASVNELSRLMARLPQKIAATVLFVRPSGVAASWEETDLYRTAASIPGVTVRVDVRGREAELFGATTSGQAVVYDEKGALVFHGGITPSRGHEGDNAGSASIVAWVESGGGMPETNVYGCSLNEEAARSNPRDRAAAEGLQ